MQCSLPDRDTELALLLGHLDNQNCIFGGQTNQQDQADLGKQIVIEPGKILTQQSTEHDQRQITARLNWEFFSGFETEGKVAEASAGLREVQAGLRDFDLEVTRDVTDSYLRAEENRAGVDIADQTLELAAENLRLAEGRYKAGIGDLLEFNDAQLLFTENQSSLVVTYYNYLTALARIERAIGIIPELQGFSMVPK